MNQTQRKHVTTRVTNIFQTKCASIEREFRENSANTFRSVPYPIHPTYNEMIRKMAGFESSVELTSTREELDELLKQGTHLHPNTFTKAINKAQIDEVAAYNEVINERKKVQVDGRVVLLRHAFNRCLDTIILGEDSQSILDSINAFEQLVV